MEKILRFSFLLVICLQFSQVLGQSVDTLLEEGRNHLIQHNDDSALLIFEEALGIAKANDLLEKIPIIENNLAIAHKRKGNYPLSINFYESAITHYQAIEDDSAAATALYNLGLSQKKIGLNDAAIINFSNAIEIFQETKQKLNEALTYDALGNLYTDLELYEEAVNYHNNALTIYNSNNDTIRIARVYHNLAELYIEQNEIESASYFLKKERNIKQKYGLSLASNGVLFAELYLNQEEWDSAYSYLLPVHNERLKDGYSAELASSYFHLGDYYHRINNNAIAAIQLDSAYAISDSLQHFEMLIKVISLQLNIEKKRAKQTFIFDKYEQLMLLKNQALGELTRREAAKFDVKYESLKKDEAIKINQVEIALQKAENENLAFKYQSVVIALIIGLVFLIIIVRLGIRLKNKNTILKSQNDIINVLHKELRHRTKNYNAELIGMLSFDLDSTTNQETQELIDRYIWRLRAMSLIQSHLLIEVDQQSSNKIALKSYFSELSELILIALSGYNKDVKINSKLSDIDLELNKARSLGIALNELLQNAFKHGFKNQEHPEFTLVLTQENQHNVVLLVSDNGSGIESEEFSKKGSQGMELINSLLKKINGTIEYNSSVQIGTEVKITIPK